MPISPSPALNVRVSVTRRSLIDTWTVLVADGHDAGRQGRAATSTVDVRRDTRHRDRRGVDADQLGELIGVALDQHDVRIDRDAGDLEARRGLPGQDRG